MRAAPPNALPPRNASNAPTLPKRPPSLKHELCRKASLPTSSAPALTLQRRCPSEAGRSQRDVRRRRSHARGNFLHPRSRRHAWMSNEARDLRRERSLASRTPRSCNSPQSFTPPPGPSNPLPANCAATIRSSRMLDRVRHWHCACLEPELEVRHDAQVQRSRGW